MEENKVKEMNVNVVNDTGFADPSPVLTLIFATLCFSFWQTPWDCLVKARYLASVCCNWPYLLAIPSEA